MIERKVVFEDDFKGAPLTTKDILANFRNLVTKIDNPHLEKDEDVFVKVGSSLKPVSFNFNVGPAYDNSDSKIHKLDDIKFVSDAMRTAKAHVIINDIVYRQLTDSDEMCTLLKQGSSFEKEYMYVIALDKEPRFKINIMPSNWVSRPMSFGYFGSEGVFKYTPNFDVQPSQIELELLVKGPQKEKILVKTYDSMLEYYTKQNLKVVEPKPDNKISK